MNSMQRHQKLHHATDELPRELSRLSSEQSEDEILRLLSTYSLTPKFTQVIFSRFQEIALELCARWTASQFNAVLPAFGRILASIPSLAEIAHYMISLWTTDHDLMHDLDFVHSPDEVAQERLLALLRLLMFDNHTYARLVKPAKLQAFLYHEQPSIRYLAATIMCNYLHASDSGTEEMIDRYIGSKPASGLYEGLLIDFKFLAIYENHRRVLFADQLARNCDSSLATQLTSSRTTGPSTLLFSPLVANIHGVLMLRIQSETDESLLEDELVPTTTTSDNLRRLCTGLVGGQPLLLEGIAGSGKTCLIDFVAQKVGRADSMVKLHLNSQSDPKSLLGIYTTGREPGSFEWKPGALTRAATEGRWVLIEDIDRAPTEILSVLLPLVERRELLIPNRGETVRAAAGFRLIATLRTHAADHAQSKDSRRRMLGAQFWKSIRVTPLLQQELQHVVTRRFPLLGPYADSMIDAYRMLHDLMLSKFADPEFTRARRPTIRELLKWCTRASNTLAASGITASGQPANVMAVDTMLLDGVDSFAESLEKPQSRKIFSSILAEALHIDPLRRDHLLSERAVKLKSVSQANLETLVIGRTTIPKQPKSRRYQLYNDSHSDPFAQSRHSLRLLEQLAVAVTMREPVLLVGETGIGKTTAVQQLARSLGHRLHPINLSQQSELADLVGGFKPLNARSMAIAMKDEFDALFRQSFTRSSSEEYLRTITKCIEKDQLRRAVRLWKAAVKQYEAALSEQSTSGTSTPVDEQGRKRRKVSHPSLRAQEEHWTRFAEKLNALERQSSGNTAAFSFEFVEGRLVKAMRNGDWVLLDEINLATPDTLECLASLLEGGSSHPPRLQLMEAGRLEVIVAHPQFRVFAAMNPSTDVTKKDLPLSVRGRFTEIFVLPPDQDPKALQAIVSVYVDNVPDARSDSGVVRRICDLYRALQGMCLDRSIANGDGTKPLFSLRTLTRSLAYAKTIAPLCHFSRALYEGFYMCFVTCLGLASAHDVDMVLKRYLFADKRAAKVALKQAIKPPLDPSGHIELSYQMEAVDTGQKPTLHHHWARKGALPCHNDQQYIITPFIGNNLRNLIRASSACKFPILIQGPTSAGKTSIIEYLAKRTGHQFVRINNHEHTDLQEYLGTYVSAQDGRLVFQDGVLVQALRHGHWIVLDELNLAPTDVLEALNRLLDDNRELLIPETQELVSPHPDFMLFATQNPPGAYGGRKTLSKAFQNRFIELHFDEIPVSELKVILSRRSTLPESWCALIVDTHKELARRRQADRVFEHDSFATLRDLFRWSFRGGSTLEEVADNGFMVLAEKARTTQDRNTVRDVLTKTFSRKGVIIKIDESRLYKAPAILANSAAWRQNVIWSPAMRRLYTLTAEATKRNEAVLLVGPTGSGKTTICQTIAQVMGKPLHIFNAHQNTETGDLIGAQRPARNRSTREEELRESLLSILSSTSHIKQSATRSLEALLSSFDELPKEVIKGLPHNELEQIRLNRVRSGALFEWCDGSIVQAMKAGHLYLLDELSLADDSVLERLNSVLDPSRTITLAEKGGFENVIQAKEGFQFLATMNPGGDFGKKELSPALRNRFTEIWVPPVSEDMDIVPIVEAKLPKELKILASRFVGFARWFAEDFWSLSSSPISIRDLLAWTYFVNVSDKDAYFSIIHGAAMVYIDTLGANPAALIAMSSKNDLTRQKAVCLERLSTTFQVDAGLLYSVPSTIEVTKDKLYAGPFELPRTKQGSIEKGFKLNVPTTSLNAMRIVRAMTLPKPILIEGSPGVGKTTLVAALASCVGVHLTRINLSEQTDLIDLFGSDTPIDDEVAGSFAWKDAPFLTAMKNGTWVLLDEMNLASQSILEGLNSCLDHREEVYVAELDQTFTRHPNFRLFAAQNPHSQGSGRKGLPSSFVNRFTVVYAEALTSEDMIIATSDSRYPHETLTKVVSFVGDLDQQVNHLRAFGLQGSPWEFNLRDVQRWLHMQWPRPSFVQFGRSRDLADALLLRRFRSTRDLEQASAIFGRFFAKSISATYPHLVLLPQTLEIGAATYKRGSGHTGNVPISLTELKSRIPFLQSLLLCISQNWPVLLVGGAGAGKTQTLKQMAALLGYGVQTFSLSPDIDANDLIGGFEQSDILKHIDDKCDYLLTLVETLLRKVLVNIEVHDVGILIELITILKQESTALGRARVMQSMLAREHSAEIDPEIKLAMESISNLEKRSHSATSVKFQWCDGALVRAMQKGQWLVLDNANLCSPSVLDRLNSLLEPNGTLTINEHSLENGQPREVIPHPDFRIFLTVDPMNGEISRAMRNRAVELFVPGTQNDENTAKRQNIYRAAPISSTLAIERVLEIFHDRPPEHEFRENIFRYILDHLSMKDITTFSSFLQGAGQSVFDDDAHTGFGIALEDLKKAELVFSPLRQRVCHCMGETAGCDILQMKIPSAQPASPILDETLYGIRNGAQDTEAACVIWATRIRDALLDLTHLDRTMAEAYPQGKSLAQMTLLQRDMVQDRVAADSHHSTRGTAALLQALLQAILTSISSLVSDLSNPDADPPDQKILISFNLVICFWQLLFKVVSSQVFEEVTYNALLEHGVSTVTDMDFTSDTGVAFKQHLYNALGLVRSTAQSGTGQSMEAMWKLFRPQISKSWQKLQTVYVVEQLAAGFDRSKWTFQASVERLLTVHTAMLRAVSMARSDSQPVEDLTKQLQSVAIAEPSPIQSAHMRPWFQESFEAICQYSDSDPYGLFHRIHKSNGMQPSGDPTVFFAERGSLSTDLPEDVSLAFRVLERLRNYGRGSMIGKSRALDGSFAINMLSKALTSSEVCLQRMDLLRAELQHLAGSICSRINTVRQNQFENLRKLSTLWLSLILDAHPQVQISATFRKIRHDTYNELGYDAYVNSEAPKRQSKLEATYDTVSPALHALVEQAIALEQVDDHVPYKDRFVKLGEFIAGLALNSLKLLVSEQLIDPHSRQTTAKALHQEQIKLLGSKLKAVELAGDYFTGKRPSIWCETIEGDINELGSAPMVDDVPRPPVSKFIDLHFELRQVLELVNRLPGPVTDTYLIGEEVLASTDGLIRRIDAQKLGYEDLTLPVTGFLHALQLGIRIQDESKQQQTSSDILLQQIMSTVPYVSRTASSLTPCFIEISQLQASRGILELNLNLARLHASVQLRMPKDILVGLRKSLDSLFKAWKAQLLVDQDKETKAHSTYHYRGEIDEDDEDEQELLRLFDSSDNADVDDRPKVDEGQTVLDGITVAKLHIAIFSQAAPIHCLEQVFESATVLLADLNGKGVSYLQGSNVDRIFPLLMTTLWNKKTGLATGTPRPAQYNMYTDSNVEQAQRALDLAYRVRLRFEEIREVWPEQASVNDCLRVCDELLEFRWTLPVTKILTKMEKVFDFVTQWQSVASTEFTAGSLYDEIKSLLISWRQLELSSWQGLLDRELASAEDNALSWWYVAYENLFVWPLQTHADADAGNSAQHTLRIVSTVEDFLRGSNVGQFAQRLTIIKSLLTHLRFEIGDSLLCCAIDNSVLYFERFLPSVGNLVTTVRAKLDQDVKNIIQLARWKDTNPVALKQSARASHKQLFKIIRKFRKMLNENVQLAKIKLPPVEDWDSSQRRSALDSEQHIQRAIDLSETAKGSNIILLARDWPKRYQNVSTTVEALQRRLSLDIIDLSAHTALQSFLNDLSAQVEHLRKSTPNTLTTENAALVKHLTTRKRKLFSTTLKELRSMGLKANLSTTNLSSQDSIAKVLTQLPNPALMPSTCSQVHFLGALDSLFNTKSASKQHHEDLSDLDVTRSMGYLQHLFNVALRQRTHISQVYASALSLHQLTAQMQSLYEKGESNVNSFTTKQQRQSEDLESALNWVPVTLEMTCKLLQLQSKMADIDISTIISKLSEFEVEFSRLKADLLIDPTTGVPWETRRHATSLARARELVAQLIVQLDEMAKEQPDVDLLLTQCRANLPRLDGKVAQEENRFNGDWGALERQLLSGMDEVLGAAQDVQSALTETVPLVDVEHWLIRSDRFLAQVLQSFHGRQVQAIASSLCASLSGLNCVDPGQIHQIVALFVTVLPILLQFLSSFDKWIDFYAKLHESTIAAVQQLSNHLFIILANGFCKPQESSAESAQTNDKLESGTGLGEGEGAEDISKDVGEDEDLEELAQQENEDSKNTEIEKTDDAKDIADQLAGGIGDETMGQENEDDSSVEERKDDSDAESGNDSRGEQEDFKGEDEQELGGQKDADDTVGDVDDLNPSAVDEKMWDDPDMAAAKDKDGRKDTGLKNKDGKTGADDGEDGKDETDHDEEPDETKDDQDLSESDGEPDMDLDAQGPDPRDSDKLDPHARDEQPLDISEDLQLDGDKKSGMSDEDSDLDMDGGMSEDDEISNIHMEDLSALDNSEPDVDADEKDVKSSPEDDDTAGAERADAVLPEQSDIETSEQAGEAGDKSESIKDNFDGPLAEDQTGNEDQSEQNQERGAETMTEHQQEPNDSSQSNARRQDGVRSQPKESDAQPRESSKDAASSQKKPQFDGRDDESMRKLGDALNRWYRQQEKVGQPSQEEREQGIATRDDIDMTDVEFQHVEDDDVANAQALDAAENKEQQVVDEKMAIDLNDQHEGRAKDPQVEYNAEDTPESASDMEVDEEHEKKASTGQETAPSHQTSFIGTRTFPHEQRVDSTSEVEMFSENDPELSKDLDNMQLDPSAIKSYTSFELWQRHVSRTHESSLFLTSQLRLILEPTTASRLRGDFRTGKRLNMKRIIPYIASQYKRDKIWLRRALPSTRNYQIVLAVDDSKSMLQDKKSLATKEGDARSMAFDTLALVARSLSILEVGQVGVVAFAETTRILHPLDKTWTGEAGAEVLAGLQFEGQKTNVKLMVEQNLDMLRQARMHNIGSSNAETWQVVMVIGDGICEDHDSIRRLLLRAQEERVMFVFIIIDAIGSQSTVTQSDKASIMDLESVSFVPSGEKDSDGNAAGMRVERRKYMDSFPFAYYLVVRDVRELPNVLATALRQWFAEVVGVS